MDVTANKALDEIVRLQDQLAALTAERDAAIARAEKAETNFDELTKYVSFCQSDIGALAEKNDELRQCLERLMTTRLESEA